MAKYIFERLWDRPVMGLGYKQQTPISLLYISIEYYMDKGGRWVQICIDEACH